MDLNELNELAAKELAARKKVRVLCCVSSGCVSAQAKEVKQALVDSFAASSIAADVQVVGVGCMGLCSQGPSVRVEPEGLVFEKVTPENAHEIAAALTGGKCSIGQSDIHHPFFAKQERIVLENSGSIDPDRIEEYIAVGGYKSLYAALHDHTPTEVIETITKSGLRGRGGAGFPTGLKWGMVNKSSGPRKFVLCNGDEGDPGAFMDRSVLESDPHRVLEGMAIAAYAVGAEQGYIYVRGEYPLAIQRLQTAIKQARFHGILGTQIFDTAFNFRVDLRIGGGAFVCGEETALIASIEGQRGTPRPRPPFPAVSGLWGCPTLINNVETYANIPTIVRKGADWYAGIGTEKSKGTKVFALVGKITHSGLIEVPMGTPLRTIVEEMGGGAPEGATVKAVQTGGPSGGCIPASLFDTNVDFESLAKVGSIMGSGGMIVMDERDNMVDIARFFMEFCMDESCGKCVPCRAGTIQMYDILTRLSEGEGTDADIDRLRMLCDVVKNTSLCGLGQTAPNPVLSTLRYFEHEYKDKIAQNKNAINGHSVKSTADAQPIAVAAAAKEGSNGG
ncbi:MAG TPA: NADH-quinone oxidoreductase subunit NuoF [Capsulimonadaceae bacterium]|jgi:bidirectional [NiFe] hydrogenase diaphorase subunit